MQYYHAYNGIFTDNTFQQSFTQDNQTIRYCGVNTQFQNGKAKKFIRDLQEHTRKQLHHTKARWPSAVELALWTYTLQKYTYLWNFIPDKEDAYSPLDRFSNVIVDPKIKENHSFGRPVYALHNHIPGGGRVPK